MKSQTRAVQAHDKHMQALELRKAGLTITEIAARVGLSRTQVHRVIDRLLKDTKAEAADELRTLELARLDTAQVAIWAQVRQGNHGAIDRLLRIMERRAKLLGLDAPARQEVTGANGTAIETTQHVFSHALVTAAFAPRPGHDPDAPGADEGGGDGAAVGKNVHGGRLRADRG